MATFDELGREPAAGRVVDRADDAEHQRHHVHGRDRDDVRQVEHAENDRLDTHRGLRDDRQPPPVEAVGQGAGPQSDQQHREELAGGDDAERQPVATEIAHEQHLSGRLQPGADVRYRHPSEEQLGVALAQRAEHLRTACLRPRHRVDGDEGHRFHAVTC